MRIACLGGGPAGLYFAIAMKLRDPAHEIVGGRAQPARRHVRLGRRAVRRDAGQSRSATIPVSAAAIRAHFAYWDDIAVHYRGTVHALSAATASAASAASGCCNILQDRARELGVELRFETEVDERSSPMRDYDLVVAADGVNSKVRTRASPTSSSPTSTCAPASSSGSARTRNSTTPSPSSSRRPSTAGSGRTPTSSTPTPRPSSSSAREETWRSVRLRRA